MNLSPIQTRSLVVVMFVLTNAGVAQDQATPAARPVSLLDCLQPDSWATIATDQAGYRLRVLTDQEKKEAEQTIEKYRALRGQGVSDDGLTEAYRTMPSDVRADRFYTIRRFGSDAVELKDDEIHAVLPLTSVRVLLLGPKGSFASGGPFDRRSSVRSSSPSPQDFFQAIRGGGRGGIVGRSESSGGSSGGRTGGLLGAVVATNKAPDNKQQHAKPNVFFLKYAEADILVEIIAEVYSDSELRIAIEPRLNAVVVQSEPEVVEQIEQLIATLDRQIVDKPEEPAEVPTLKTYSIEGADANTVLQVLQTLLAGHTDLRISLDTTTNRLIALARTADHETIKATIKELDSTE